MDRPDVPRVTFLLLAYEQASTVGEACASALAQDYPNLEVILSDDCSSDATFAIMSEVASGYAGPHAVRLNRNERNLGLIGHVNRAMELASGELVVAAAGDDVSVPARTRRLVECYLSSGRSANSIHSAVETIDASGKALGVRKPALREIGPETPDATVAELALRFALVIGASHAWTRRVFDTFGPIRASGTYEDLVIAFRSALLGRVGYVDEPLVRYRVANGLSTSGRHLPWRQRQLRSRRVRIATLEQRRADLQKIGRAVPRPLEDAVALERALKELLEGDVGGLVRFLRAPHLLAVGLRRVARIVATAGPRR